MILLTLGFLLAIVLFIVVAVGAERFSSFYTRLTFLCVSWVLCMVAGSAVSDYRPSDTLQPIADLFPGFSNGLALSSQLFVLLLLVSLWRVFPGRNTPAR